MPKLYKLLRPAFFKIEPETAHTLTIKALKSGIIPACRTQPDPALETILWGHKFPNPVGLAAGFDKNAEVIAPAFRMGFGFIEVGTVTRKPQSGNPKPRIFREPAHESVINRMGFPNAGMHTFKDNIERFLSRGQRPQGVLGINIGMNKEQKNPEKDYRILIRMLGPMADYLTINISSPNTPGLRDLQEKGPLLELLSEIMDERKKSCGNPAPPILVKLAPDLNEKQQKEIAETLIEAKVDGIILGNTTLDRPDFLSDDFKLQRGGLSGKPLQEKSTQIIRNFYKLTDGKIPIIGAGGISSAQDAYDKIRAGASLVQLYTALVFQGPFMVKSITNELSALLKANAFKHISDAVGTDV